MAYNQDGPFRAFPTNGDLSAAQKKAVVLNGSGTLDVAGAGVQIAGVLIDDPKSGKSGTIQVRDVAKVIAGAAVTVGQAVKTDASGRAITATTGNTAFGVAYQSASGAGSVIAVELHTPGFIVP